jgi:putative endonuclease
MEYQDTRKNIGDRAEQSVQEYLIKSGFKIIEKNFRLEHNEIDIIASKDKLIVFVEVRSKSANSRINPEETITAQKQKSIFKVANYYINKNKLKDVDFRFDIIFVYYTGGGYDIQHFEDALMYR